MLNWLSNSVLGYPVAEQQVFILNLIGINGYYSLWLLRLLSFVVLGIALYLFYKIIIQFSDIQISKISVLMVIITPLFFILGLIYPFLCLKFLLFVIGVNLGIKNKWFYLVLVLGLMVFNYQILGNKASIFYKLNFKDAQTEVTNRISSEDSLKESIVLPLWWRRITYNKFFFSYKQIVAEFLPFFDFESIFFQEINPLSQKSIVIFYWPEIYLFVLGIYFLYNLNNRKFNKFILVLLLISWLDFVFSEGSIFKRLVLVVFPISLIIGVGFYNLYRNKGILSKISFYLVSVFILFGLYNSFCDLSARREYWLDNRPIAFAFWYEELLKIDISKYDSVQITSIVGNSKPYCYFYLGNVCDSKFVFESFDLTKTKNINSIYAGFAGEFVGFNFKNNISSTWNKTTNINIISTKSLRDTIANQYGNDIGIGVIN